MKLNRSRIRLSLLWGLILLNLIMLLACVLGSGARTRTPQPTDTQPLTTPTGLTGTPSIPLPNAEVVLTHQPNTGFGMLLLLGGVTGGETQMDDRRAKLIATTNARYARFNIRWADMEPQAGQLNFDTKTDAQLLAATTAGLRVLPVISVGRGWMNGNPPSAQDGGSQSYPPNDLSEAWNDQFGYSESYYNFVYQLVSHYPGYFDIVVIENEANSKIFWGGTTDAYVRLVKTAHQAIRAADPNVKVADSGFVSNAWGICIAREWMASGYKSKDEAVQMALAYYAVAPQIGPLPVTDAADVDKLLKLPRLVEECDQIEAILTNLNGAVEVINFHFYQSYDVMHFVPEWIRRMTDKAGYAVFVMCNEMGVRGPNESYAAGPEHAQKVFKDMVTARVLGLEAAIWFSADTIGTRAPEPDKISLFSSDGSGTPRSAAETFALLAGKLSEAGSTIEVLSAGPTLYYYRFPDANLEAMWTEGGGQTVNLVAPAGATEAIVTAFDGQQATYAVSGGAVPLTLTDAPVFVEWK